MYRQLLTRDLSACVVQYAGLHVQEQEALLISLEKKAVLQHFFKVANVASIA